MLDWTAVDSVVARRSGLALEAHVDLVPDAGLAAAMLVGLALESHVGASAEPAYLPIVALAGLAQVALVGLARVALIGLVVLTRRAQSATALANTAAVAKALLAWRVAGLAPAPVDAAQCQSC